MLLLLLLLLFAGYPRFGLRSEGAAAAPSEAHHTSARAGGRADPSRVEMLRCRRQLAISCHVETAHQTRRPIYRRLRRPTTVNCTAYSLYLN